MHASKSPLAPTGVSQFEDILDGYFPLQEAVAQLLARRQLTLTTLVLTHAPIMQIPNLPRDAPVPLSIMQGRGGMIDRMVLCAEVRKLGCALWGNARWHWLDGTAGEPVFDPDTRLAEPAYLQGIAGHARLPGAAEGIVFCDE